MSPDLRRHLWNCAEILRGSAVDRTDWQAYILPLLFYTPRSVVRMMVELLDPNAGESIYDPACGTGGMLLGAIERVQGGGATRARSSRRSTVKRRT